MATTPPSSDPGGAPPTGPILAAADREDPFELAKVASSEELERLHLAEEFFDKRFHRRKRSTKFAVASQALVGYVAFAGLAVNAYQSYANNQKQVRQAETDNERWNKEFERAKQADKYRAFFETSVLATDPSNPDKRLVGYALLEEFVEDRDYNGKATLMLEESLLQELRADTAASGLDDAHRNAVVAILTSLSQTNDCHALLRPARSIGKIARRHAETHDLEETTEVFSVYVRRIVGRAAMVCPSMKEFSAVREPIRNTLIKVPEIAQAKGKLTPSDANLKITEILEDRCQTELAVSGASECGDIYARYDKLCAAEKELKDDAAACQHIKAVALAHAQKVAAAAQPAPADGTAVPTPAPQP
jgi:hypothetical protein